MPRNAATNRVPQQNYNAALSFAGGSGSVVSITDASDLRFATGFTVVARAYLNTRTGDPFKGIVSKGGTASGGERNYLLALNNGNTLLNCGYEIVGGANQFATGTRVIPLNQWFMPGVTWDGANVQCYQNGTVDGSAFAATGTPCMTAADLEIGRNQNTAQEWDGVISDVMIWNRALTAQEMSDLYFSGIIPTSGFVDRWRLDEGAGGTANSQTGTHNGTVTSAVWTGNTPMKARKASVNANLVKNGNFEYAPPFTAATNTDNTYINGTVAGSTDANTGDIFGWSINNTSTGNGEAKFDSSVFFSGTASMKLSTTGVGQFVEVSNSNTGALTVAGYIRYASKISPSTTYRLTYRMKTNYVSGDSDAGARITFLEYNGTNTAQTQTTAANTYVKTTTDWTLYTVLITTAATTNYGRVRMDVYGQTGTGTLIMDAWFDDISLTPVYPEGRVPANGNLVKNFDFEVIPAFTAAGTTTSRWIDGTAAGSSTNSTYKWSQIIDATSCAISIDGTVSHSGSGSLKVDCLDATGRGRGCYGSRTGTGSSLLVSELNLYAIRVSPSTSITMTYWIKTQNVQGGGAKIAVHEHDGAGVRNTSTSATAVPGTADWQQITLTITTAATTQYLVLSAEIPTAGAAQTAWFDDIYLAKTTNPGRVLIT